MPCGRDSRNFIGAYGFKVYIGVLRYFYWRQGVYSIYTWFESSSVSILAVLWCFSSSQWLNDSSYMKSHFLLVISDLEIYDSPAVQLTSRNSSLRKVVIQAYAKSYIKGMRLKHRGMWSTGSETHLFLLFFTLAQIQRIQPTTQPRQAYSAIAGHQTPRRSFARSGKQARQSGGCRHPRNLVSYPSRSLP